MSAANGIRHMKQHKRQVLNLYKRVLRVNKQLPKEFRLVGNAYVRDEFKRHKTMAMDEGNVKEFLSEWKMYADHLEVQLKQNHAIGSNLSSQDLNRLSEDQLGQLYHLQEEVTKPSIPTP
ncbi:Succinate dehydrogenase assembly factor 3, mitochondrial [Trichoplax sp. H2]|nr:Succinate dehydrogenase assembly factor 3, mitochondrial [Trichoplax sp. H2]|eukprot:RDD45672.1 Succinate dehydrogenase assembly factor 3, mitochondrial [Trichoplax sp. H2]